MKNIRYPLIFLIVILLSSCEKTNFEQSLLNPPFKRCHLSKEYIDGKLFREIIYKDGTDFEIDYIVFYQGDRIREDWTEHFTYAHGKIESYRDSYYIYRFTYNENDNISTIEECDINSKSCCKIHYIYNRTLLVSKETKCDNGYRDIENFDYINDNNRSYFIYNSNNYSGYALKFRQAYINPFVDVYPEGDYFTNKEERKYSGDLYRYIIDHDNTINGYPKKVQEYKFTSSGSKLTLYTYEYTGCD